MRSPDTVSLHMLRRYHFDELSSAERAKVEAALGADAGARERLAKMRASEAAFLGKVDVAAESVGILEKLDRARPSLLSRVLGARTFQLAAAFVVLIALVPIGRTFLVDHPTTREKGSARLEMFVKDETGVRKGENGMVLHEGDQIQFRYRAVGRRYVFVVSVDSRGVVSPLYPDGEANSIPVRPDGLHTLEGSVILDDAIGPERIIAVFSDDPVSYRSIEAALQRESDLARLQHLDLQGEDVDQASILIIKE